MHPFLSPLSQCRDFVRLEQTLKSGADNPGGLVYTPCKVATYGVCRSARAYLVASLLARTHRSALIISSDVESANSLAIELQALLPLITCDEFSPRVQVLPPHDFLFEATASPDSQVVQDRLQVLETWHHRNPCVVIAPVNALAGFTVPPDRVRRGTFSLSVGDEVGLEDLLLRLTDDGYDRVETVERVSEFSLRGGILDVFPSICELPIRLEFFGDEIVSMRFFDPGSQRSQESLETCEICPPREMILTDAIVQEAIPRIQSHLHHQRQSLTERGLHGEAQLLGEIVAKDLMRLEQLAYFPGVERYLPFLYPEGPRLIDFVPNDTVVFIDEFSRLERFWDRVAEEFDRYLTHKVDSGEFLPPPIPWIPNLSDLLQRFERHQTCEILPGVPEEGTQASGRSFLVNFQLLPGFQGQMAMLAERLKQWQAERRRIVCSTHHPQRLMELFRDTDVAGFRFEEDANAAGSGETVRPAEILIASYGLLGGFEIPEADLLVLTDAELFGWSGVHRRWRKRREGSQALRSLVELNAGDYVVHIGHGIGLYQGITRQKVGDSENEYLMIQYAGSDKLFVPVHQIDRLQKYIGSDGAAPVVHPLSGNSWESAKRKAHAAAKDIAEDLAKLYAARESATGHVFAPDTPWQRELEVSFDWEETPDQAKAIEAVKADMESDKPMDRLICGDVGYGKTEVALRAAFKALQENKQVAVLVPTTVLAQQHFNTFKERLAPYPVNLELLSRFRSPVEQERAIQAIRAGSVDVVIGTHRLLSKDVVFKDLGLLIVDEEHRFGVEQKERLKELRTQVDVLTLTATPIPRTMHMALGGIREMTVINDPPQGRLPVRTYVTQFDDELVRSALLREMERGGQVYFVHNRVRSIRHMAAHVSRLVPTARIAIGHGQLPEDELEEIMFDFFNGKYDILICTTIIESGLDVPNANTLIVDRCEQMGLAQLYQLRGRVGRSDRQAYAYFLYGRRSKIGHAAEQRIEALKEFSGLGSGFKIALRDLEIRGAGNLLGAEQHGFIQAVGFDLYCEMLGQAVKELRNEPVTQRQVFPEVDLPVSAYLPEDYIPNLNQRLDFYRRLAAVETMRDLDLLEEELKDRFGVMPIVASNLLRVMRARVTCSSIWVQRISQVERQILLRFDPLHKPSEGECVRLYRVMAESHPRGILDTIRVRADGMSVNPLELESQQVLRLVEDLVNAFASWRAQG